MEIGVFIFISLPIYGGGMGVKAESYPTAH